MIPLLPSMSYILLLVFALCTLFTGVMAASEIPPQMANFQTFYRAAFYFFLAAETAHFAQWYFVLIFSPLSQKQHILVWYILCMLVS